MLVTQFIANSKIPKIYKRPFDSTTSTRFDLKFFRVLSKDRHPGILHCTFFSPEKLALLSLLKEVDTSPDCKMLNDAGSRASSREHYLLLRKSRTRSRSRLRI